MTQFKEEFLKDQEDNLSVIYSVDVHSGPDPDDDDWTDDDDDFEDDVDSDIDEELVSPVVPDADIDEDDEGTWVDDDEDDDLLGDEDDEDITSESDNSDITTEADRREREDLGTNLNERPYGRNRRTGRMIDHEPGSTGSGDPNL